MLLFLGIDMIPVADQKFTTTDDWILLVDQKSDIVKFEDIDKLIKTHRCQWVQVQKHKLEDTKSNLLLNVTDSWR